MSEIGHVAEALAQLREKEFTAERNLSFFYKDRSYLGSNDRRFISDTYYHVIRHLIRIDESIRISMENAPWLEWISRSLGFPASEAMSLSFWFKEMPPPARPYPMDRWFDMTRAMLAATDLDRTYIQKVREALVEDWPKKESWHQGEWVERLLVRSAENMRHYKAGGRTVEPEIQYSIPTFFYSLLGSGLRTKELPDFYASLNDNAPVGLRVNTNKATRDEYLDLLKDSDLQIEPSELTDHGLITYGRIPKGKLPKTEEGFVEFQDIASQVLVESLDIKPGEKILDACAGGGGKALQLSNAVGESGQIFVHDASPRRLMNTFERATRAASRNVTSLTPINAKSHADVEALEKKWESWPKLNPYQQNLDWIVIDAPCTGSGTVRRQPELKYKIDQESLREIILLQQKLLDHWSGQMTSGATLVYMTCSFFREENENQVERFLSKHPDFEKVNFENEVLKKKKLITREGFIRTFPHRHQGDGFFMAKLRKK